MITVYEEQRNGAVADTIEHSHASLETCLEVIRRMDGFTRSQVTIRYMENMIMIGGGSHEFIVTVETDTTIHNLLGPLEEEDEFVEITVGGQACEFPQKYIVSLELIESALLQFLEGTTAELNWEIIDK
ncbi:Imm1 family immunity protein [Paenibacillus sp. N3/727]|uniref:Imm1 family immunity protein n=1 Tax=Paenibacillus sp. N3/727 TaxID=2925845 RepID=UPI001F53C11F|nr:Imm1 family immunity protein [Paenibacillus sp. N3/727]UNK21100.1 Imm1 family immunity protein [Paenibacillus sp. N3/727]